MHTWLVLNEIASDELSRNIVWSLIWVSAPRCNLYVDIAPSSSSGERAQAPLDACVVCEAGAAPAVVDGKSVR